MTNQHGKPNEEQLRFLCHRCVHFDCSRILYREALISPLGEAAFQMQHILESGLHT